MERDYIKWFEEIVEKNEGSCFGDSSKVAGAAMLTISKVGENNVPMSFVEKLISSPFPRMIDIGLKLVVNRKDLDMERIDAILEENKCVNTDIHHYENYINILDTRNLLLERLKKGIAENDNWVYYFFTYNSLKDKYIPLLEGYMSDIWKKKFLKAMKGNYFQVKLDSRLLPSNFREIEPGEKVYKKCLNDVIIVAEIPEDANIFMDSNYAGKIIIKVDKAIVVDIVGSFYGEKVGISRNDPSFFYEVGKTVEAKNFKWAKDGEGLYFYLSLEDLEEEGKNLGFGGYCCSLQGFGCR